MSESILWASNENTPFFKKPVTDVGAFAPEVIRGVRAFHSTFPGYQPTPLHSLPALAKLLGVKAIYLKDESLKISDALKYAFENGPIEQFAFDIDVKKLNIKYFICNFFIRISKLRKIMKLY